ncbi:unnamed protein product [Arabidopsis thaliana]|uniref:(thale cress) hypothetical protein n=1 Tax=Arabidopsis thaliana TaxID=3702 RepID=A0A7G2FBX7_ARATH|nr:unnamed protein product [Arabidopsis thaliana]
MDVESSSPSSHALIKKEKGGWRAIKYIIANESFEKLASMSLIGNLSVYLMTKYNLGGVFLVNVINICVFADIVKVVTAACKKRKVKPGSDITFYIGPSNDGSPTTLVRDKHRLRFFDKASIVTNPNELNEDGNAKYKWRLCSVQQVKNLKCVTAILPVWVTGIACFILTDQQNIYGILQAMQMDKTFGPHNFQVPAGWMNLVSMITLAIWISLYECVIIPIVKQITGRKKRLTLKHRIEIGIVMGIICMIVAGFQEKKRRASALKNGSFVSPVSIVMLLPQFALAGLTEAFSSVALMEFLTVRMPEHMRAVAGAIFFLSSSIASYICTLLINVIDAVTRKEGKSWLGDKDLNKNRLENYFFIIAGIQVANLLYFRLFASRYATENKKGH